MKGKILIVDDLADFRKLLRSALEDNNIITEADSKAALEKAFALEQPDLVLLDVKLPDGNGLDLLPAIKKRWPETEVIVLTGAPDEREALSWAVEATKRGAFNFIRKSAQLDLEKLLADVGNALDSRQRTEETSMLRRALETMSGNASPVFQSLVMREVVRTVERIAPSDVAVLITGESGTGKEVIADLIHAFSPRCKNRIVKINCAALPRELIESELFGSVKGAFTGAHSDREGLFRQAEGGTVFMAMPEAAVDEDHGLIFGQDEVGFAGQHAVFRAVHREAVAEAVEQRAQGQLGLGVAAADAGHDLGAFFRTEDVGHGCAQSKPVMALMPLQMQRCLRGFISAPSLRPRGWWSRRARPDRRPACWLHVD